MHIQHREEKNKRLSSAQRMEEEKCTMTTMGTTRMQKKQGKKYKKEINFYSLSTELCCMGYKYIYSTKFYVLYVLGNGNDHPPIVAILRVLSFFSSFFCSFFFSLYWIALVLDDDMTWTF